MKSENNKDKAKQIRENLNNRGKLLAKEWVKGKIFTNLEDERPSKNFLNIESRK